jgi:3-hydroxybutyryl-CoA dehydrogenase
MKIGLVGAGLMGAGLARLFTRAGWQVAVFDPDRGALDRLGVETPGLTLSQEMAAAVAGADLVVEAAPEKPPLKQSIFADLAAATGPETILATNSSVIPVGVVTEKLSDADAARAVGTHFWNPPDLIPLVEVIQGPRSGLPAIERTLDILRKAGKDAVHVKRDTVPGNRLQHALWREALALVDEGICAPEDVDTIVKRSFGLRLPVLGPLENADLVGLELTEDIHKVVLPTLSRATEPAKSLRERIARGDTGGKAGAGFYPGWTEDKIAQLKARIANHLNSLLQKD